MLLYALMTFTSQVADVSMTAKGKFDEQNRAVIQRNYPPRAKHAGEEGQVGFKVRIDDKGRPMACQVTKTSGFPRLDRETCEVILAKTKFGKTYDPSGRSVEVVSEGVITWVLTNADYRRADVSKQIRSASIEDGEEIRCKYDPKPGTMIVKTKVCLTQHEWDLTHFLAREEIKRLTATWMSGQ